MNKKLAMVFLYLLSFITLLAPAPVKAAPTPLVISEVQTESMLSAKHELIEIHNNSDTEILLEGWRLEYVSSSGKTVTKLIEFLDAEIGSREFMLLTSNENSLVGEARFKAGMASTAGHVRLRNADNSLVDVLSWGNVDLTSATVLVEGTPAPAAGDCQALQRKLGDDGLLVDTDDNITDFVLTQASYPTNDSECTLAPVVVDSDDDDNEPAPPLIIPIEPPCLLIISEVLANPAGTDADREYVELHNPTDAIQVAAGCRLRLSATGTEYKLLEAADFLPDEYRIFTSSMVSPAGMQLVNSGGEVWLYDFDQEHQVSFPGLKDDEAWALIGDTWQITNDPTPSAKNRPNVAEVEEVKSAVTELTPCSAGKERNPDTNRCRTIEVNNDELTPCKEGQERNPDTNRCRAVASTSSSLTPCHVGQERNPDTNRCRYVAEAAALVACQNGYERNPDTNRCRKTTGTNPTANFASINGAANDDRSDYRILVIGLMAALSYGVFEYRNDFSNAIHKFRTKRALRETSVK